MSIFKRGKVYRYHFTFNGEHIQESTHQHNREVAREMESRHRSRLAQEFRAQEDRARELRCEMVLRCFECEKWFDSSVAVQHLDHDFCCEYCQAQWNQKHTKIPTLAEFCKERLLPWAEAQYERNSLKTWQWYRTGVRALCDYAPLADCRLDRITSEQIAGFAAHRQTHSRRIRRKGNGPDGGSAPLKVSSVNGTLQVVRRCLKLAIKWGVIKNAPAVEMLRNPNHRDRVLSATEEAKYLAVAPEPLVYIATVLVDSGLRPEECLRLRWENVFFDRGRYGLLFNPYGKTKAARRVVPMSPRLSEILERKWSAAAKPEDGWVFVADTKSGHAEPSTVKKQHRNAVRASRVRPFVLYTFRHTFLTRLGESGCDVYTLARIAGHSNIAMSMRYVHPGEESVLSAMERLEAQRSKQGRESADDNDASRALPVQSQGLEMTAQTGNDPSVCS